jgi:hypothetical protein
MKTYPFSAPIILNDTIFQLYGGQTGTWTAPQRTAAYLIAETQASNYIGSLLLPTVVTGTWGYASRIVTDYGYVHQVYAVNFLTINNPPTSVLTSNTGYSLIWEDTYGYLDVFGLLGYCNCSGGGIPYQVQVAYQAGLPTGVASQPSVLLALTMAAQISLNEMIFPSQNEGVGDIGIQSFSSMDYSERRVAMRRTAFGTSAKAEKIAQLIDSSVKKARPALVFR